MDTKTVEISDGRTVTVRRPKGRDLNNAHNAAGEGANKFKLSCAVLGQICSVGGTPLVMEDILDLYASDIDLLSTAAASDFLSSGATASPSSSNGDSPSAS